MFFQRVLLSFSVTMVSSFIQAQEDDEVTKADVVHEQVLGPSAKTKDLKVLIHKAGHLEGRPYVIEISEKCGKSFHQKVIDVASVCDIAKDTLKFDRAKSELSILVRDPADVSVSSQCRLKAKLLTFQLQSGCDNI